MSALYRETLNPYPNSNAERRQLARYASQLTATIIRPSDEFEKCIITDYSGRGAQIMRFFSDPIPDVFEFNVADELIIVAHVVWQRNSRLGVRFEY